MCEGLFNFFVVVLLYLPSRLRPICNSFTNPQFKYLGIKDRFFISVCEALTADKYSSALNYSAVLAVVHSVVPITVTIIVVVFFKILIYFILLKKKLCGALHSIVLCKPGPNWHDVYYCCSKYIQEAATKYN